MTKQQEAAGSAQKQPIDWIAIEKHYRAGIRSLRSIADEYGITEAAIRKRAKRDAWTRNLEERIQLKAQEKVRKALVRTPGTQLTRETETRTIEDYSTVVSSVDLRQRDDVELAMNSTRGLLMELVQLSRPDFKEMLEEIADAFDESGPGPNGGWKTDKANELYRYIISLAGRVKIAKDIAASHGTYIPMQRKMFRLDDDDSKKSSVDDLLEAIGAA